MMIFLFFTDIEKEGSGCPSRHICKLGGCYCELLRVGSGTYVRTCVLCYVVVCVKNKKKAVKNCCMRN